MKTAISLPDSLFSDADELAERLGLSRSELYARAVAEFLAKHHRDKVTVELDRVYGQESSKLDPALRRAAAKTIRDSEW